jgi:hypothetical protein
MKSLRPQTNPLKRWAVFGSLTAMTLAGTITGPAASATSSDDPTNPAAAPATANGDSVVLQWNKQVSEAMRVNNQGSPHPTPPPVGGRTLAVVHNAMYDAWAAYDAKAVGTQLGGDLRRPAAERTEANKRKAISFAAHRALGDLFPEQRATFDAKLAELGYDAAEAGSAEAGTPAAVAVTATDALLEVRHQDGSNQQASPAYKTPEGYYEPVNQAQDVDDFDKSKIVDPSRWTPLRLNGLTHDFLTPHFADVEPFLIDDVDSYLPPAPPRYGSGASRRAIAEQMKISVRLTERQKAIAEHWQYRDTSSSSIPQEWAAFISRRDRHSLDEDVKLYFALNVAQGDEAAVDWKTKVHFDYGRPITMIRYAMDGKKILGYAGPDQGTKLIDGAKWQPYLKTPAFAAYGSGHTGFTAVGAEILKQFTGSDRYGGTGVVKAGSSAIETNMPSKDIKLKWATFSDAAKEVGESRLWGGVHWKFDHTVADTQGRELARDVYAEAQQYFDGTHPDA